jgi:hypothetical protein
MLEFALQHLASGLHQAFDPAVTGSGLVRSDVAVLAVWGAPASRSHSSPSRSAATTT